MKNSYTKFIAKGLLAIVAGAGLFTACQKSNLESTEPTREGKEITIEAITEQSAATRTTLSVGETYAELHWVDGDKAIVFTPLTSTSITAVVNTTDSTRATFTGSLPTGDPISVIYPTSSAKGTDKVLFRETMPYAKDNIANGMMPMYAPGSEVSSTLAFKNLAGIVKIQLKGSEVVRDIKLTSPDIISGTATIDYNAGNPTVIFYSGGGNSITLDCSAEEGGGVQLNETTPTSFYITVPPTTSNEFTIKVTTTANEAMIRSTTQSSGTQIRRNVISVMPELTFTPKVEFTYTYDETFKTAKLTGYSADITGPEPFDLVIPSHTIRNGETYTVTEIAEGAFYRASEFSGGLYLPETLIKIGNLAFQSCSGLTGELILPQSLKTIGYQAFEHAKGFEGDLIIPDGVTTIGGAAFAGCSGFNGKLVLSKNLTVIDEVTFVECTGLTGDIVIPENVTSIRGGAFQGCTNLKGELTLPNSLKDIDPYAFAYCGFTAITSNAITPPVISTDTFNNEGGTMWKLTVTVPVGSKTSYETAEGWFLFVESGGGFDISYEFTFTYDDVAKTAAITGLASGSTPGSANLILPSTTLHNGETYTVTEIAAEAFRSGRAFSGTLTLPENLITIGEYAFEGCIGLTGELKIPNTVTTIGARAFKTCEKLSGTLIIPENVKRIEESTFYDCESFTGVIFPEGLEVIEVFSFYFAYDLSGSLVLPASLTKIDRAAFYNCAFTSITSKATTPPTLGENAFGDFTDYLVSLTVAVPGSSISAYEGDTEWGKFAGFTAM